MAPSRPLPIGTDSSHLAGFAGLLYQSDSSPAYDVPAIMAINEKYINDLVDVPLSQSQFDALVSWVYNLGPANLKSSTLLKVLNKGEYKEVPSQMRRWNKANGKVLEGLIRRRAAESLLFEGKEWGKV